MSMYKIVVVGRIVRVLILAAGLSLLFLAILIQPARTMAGHASARVDSLGSGDRLTHRMQAMSNTFSITVTDQTPTAPLTNPTASGFAPRYISGFGLDDSFTVFFEDRDQGSRISFNTTSSGPLGFTAVSTPTNIVPETHFVVKDWPITISDTPYAYRGWGSVGNNALHHFFVSNNLITWTLVSTFTISKTTGFTDARGFVYYGFHDVIKLNDIYYAFGESNQGQTMIVSSTLGADEWVAFDSVGGTQAGDGPLQLPSPARRAEVLWIWEMIVATAKCTCAVTILAFTWQ